MPNKTFNNLTEKRKKEIINASFEEFALYDYESASLSRIISNLGLAKGSFYRYFENKLDLYIYLCQYARKLIAEKYTQHLVGKDFFKDWGEFFLSFSEIENEYPMAIRFRFRAAIEQSSVISGNQNNENSFERTKFMSSVIQKYQEKGLIRKDIDLDFFSLLMTFFNFALIEHIIDKYDISETSSIYSVNQEVLKQEIEILLNILRKGWEPDSN